MDAFRQCMSNTSDGCSVARLMKNTGKILAEAIGEADPCRLYVVLVAITLVLVALLFLFDFVCKDLSNQTTLYRPLDTHDGSIQSLIYPREPRWHVFTWVNVVATVLFLWSVVDFTIHYSNYGTRQSYRHLVIWSVFLCYFFSFFGISLIYEDVVKATFQRNPSKGDMKNSECPRSQSGTDSLRTLRMSVDDFSDDIIAEMVLQNRLKDHELESLINPYRAVIVRRRVLEQKFESLGRKDFPLENLPYLHSLNYSHVFGANCDSVVGYVPMPVGIVGPMTMNGESIFFPMATTEGCLVASTQRGVKAISEGSGAFATVFRDGITRAPCIRMKSSRGACELKLWCERSQNFSLIKNTFESTTSFGKLLSCTATIAGRNVYLRLSCFSGDAMGMNMVSKGSLAVIELLRLKFPGLELVALSGNVCTDKKAAAINWIEGRGKSVVVEATIPQSVVCSTLKTNVRDLVATNLHKNLVGSAMAGSVGGFNAHASNIVSAVFLATGQDPAQTVESSNCITLLEETESGDLWISCTMPSLEVGTVGGGTSLDAQSACLQIVGCQGSGMLAGKNSQQLAKVVASAVMAGELSLLSALTANTLVAAHMRHNRKH